MARSAEEVSRLSLSLLLLASASFASEPALSYGEGGCGKVTGAVAMPCEGANFRPYSKMLACTFGRNYLHPLVIDTIVDAYGALGPGRVWQYGDLGSEYGGRFKPHRTHQNGASADFMTPITGADGRPALIPTSCRNKFGYGVEFDAKGSGEHGIVDWKAVGAHLEALLAAGAKRGVGIKRIILTPEYIPLLQAASPAAKKLDALFVKKQVWVRHDEHYHIDFALPAAATRPLSCKKAQ